MCENQIKVDEKNLVKYQKILLTLQSAFKIIMLRTLLSQIITLLITPISRRFNELRGNIGASAVVGFCCIMLLPIFPSGCREKSDIRDKFDIIEELVESNPPEALKMLDSIPSTSLKTKEGKARHILLTARARYRAYFDDTNDSLITIAANYYSDHPSQSSLGQSRKLLALYHQGIIRENDGNFLMALNSFLQAEAEAIATQDHFALGNIYHHLNLMYSDIHAGKEGVFYGKKSYEEFMQTDSEEHIAFSMSELGDAYVAYCQYDSAYIWAKQALETQFAAKDHILHSNALRTVGKSAFMLGKSQEAVNAYEQILYEDSDYFQPKDAFFLAKAYHAVGNDAKAMDISKVYLQADSDLTRIPYEILYARGDAEGAYRSLLRELNRDSKESVDIARQDLTRALAEFREKETQDEIESHHRGTIIWLLGICLIIAVAFIAVMMMRRSFRNNRMRMFHLMSNMESLNADLRTQLHDKESIISVKESENAHARQSYYSLLETQIQQIDEMTSLFREPTSTTENKRLFKRVSRLKDDFCDPKFLEKMEQEVNRFHNDIIRKLREEFPGLKEEDVRLFLYQVCGFSGRTITFLTGEELTALYPRRSRLKARITKSEVPSRSIFLSYFR